jgi:hypothetical protein
MGTLVLPIAKIEDVEVGMTIPQKHSTKYKNTIHVLASGIGPIIHMGEVFGRTTINLYLAPVQARTMITLLLRALEELEKHPSFLLDENNFTDEFYNEHNEGIEGK